MEFTACELMPEGRSHHLLYVTHICTMWVRQSY